MGWSKKNGVWQLHRDPLASAGLIDWFDAGVGITLNSGNVSQWIPCVSGGSSHTLLQATEVNQPLYIQQCAHFANQPAVYFTDARYLRAIWATSQSNPFTFYTVAKLVSQAGSAILFDNVQNYSSAFYNNSNQTRIFSGTAEVTLGTTNTNPCVYALEFSGASSKAFRNASGTNLISGNPGVPDLRGLTLGLNTTLMASTTAKSYLAELLVYSGTHPAATRKSIMDYLGDKYCIETT